MQTTNVVVLCSNPSSIYSNIYTSEVSRCSTFVGGSDHQHTVYCFGSGLRLEVGGGTKRSLRFLWRWCAMTGGVGHIWNSAGSFWIYDQCCLRMDDSGERFWWYGMINVSVGLVVIGLVLASNCAWLCDEAMSMEGWIISLSLYVLSWSSLVIILLYLIAFDCK